MKPRNTLLLVFAVLAFLVCVVVFERKYPTTREAAEQKLHVVDFDPAKINKIVVINNEERIELAKRDGLWFLQAPIKDQADSKLAEALMDSLLNLRPSAVLNENKDEVDIKPFGVEKSSVRLQLFGEDAPPEMLFGKNSPIEGAIYVRLANSKRIYVIPADLKNLVSKKTDDYRDRTLMDLKPAQASKMVLRSTEGEIELQKENEHWQINKPIRARANDSLINALVVQITKLQAKGFVGAKELARLSEPFGTVSLTNETSDKATSLSVIEAPDLTDRIYAKLSTRDSVFILDKVVAGLFKARPNDLRDHQLLRINFDMVDRINIQPAARPKIVLARKQENWTIDGQPANGTKVKALIDHLLSQKVVSFVTDTGSNLQKYGLEAPLVKITFSAYSSENTPETKAGEKQIACLLLGRIENGEIFAKLEEEPFVVSIDKAILDRLPDASWATK